MMAEYHITSSDINWEKQLNELAIAAGRKRQSEQTGYIHHFYQTEEESPAQTIPVMENIYFVLALFRTRVSENVFEAKELLDRLLFFQSPSDGNFPIYIHEYPVCKDRFLGAQLLPVFYYILEEFHSVLGSDLKQRLHLAANKLISLILKNLQEKSAGYPISMKIAASAKVFGIYFKDLSLEEQGTLLLDQLSAQGTHSSWLVPTAIADICIALQMVYGKISGSSWKNFQTHLIQTWHQTTRSYAGPGMKQYQRCDEPQPTLYDLFLGYFTKGFSNRALKDAIFHLQAVLIRPTEELFPDVDYPFSVEGNVNGSQWFIYQDEKFAYSLIEKKALENLAYENAFHPFSMIWGTKERVHSFVCQGGNFEFFRFFPKKKEIEFLFQLSPKFELEEREKNRELIFFFDIEPDICMSIHGESATTFAMNEEFFLKTPQLQFSLVVSLIDGEGQFLGHIMKGNRPSQNSAKGIHRFKAYDWQLFFRTLRRTPACHLKAILNIHC